MACSAGGGGRKPVRGRIANAKSFGWAIYAAGFAIWLFGYLSAGRAPLFDWNSDTPWWISSFVPNLEAELGLALMFASMIPIYWRVVRERALARLFAYTALRGRDPRVVGGFSLADLECDLGERRVPSQTSAGAALCGHRLAKLGEKQIPDQERGTIDD